ncbi:MAG: nuclear transport factor 2 family protein [Oscillospiraceae bacterium]|nr:nuclear transport factor 2 family protein [Oscillospiraceae bacterium]
MKSKVWKHLISLLCIVALVASLGITAWAADELTLEDVAAMAQKALDQQEIQNIMSRHVMYHCYGEHEEEMEEIWVQEYENQMTASFGQNQGFYVGYDSIWEAYVDGHDTSWLSSAKSYCENNGIDISGMTDDEILEIYGGVGQLLLHVTTTAIIEVAEDGQTAKAFWYSPGMIAESGQSGNTIWEAYGVDFVKEDGEWKMWHLHMFTDFMGSFYLTLGGSSSGGGGTAPSGSSGEASSETAEATDNSQQEWQGEGGSQVAASTVHDYLSSVQYYEFSSDRLRSDMEIFIPTGYDEWSFDDDNYGPTAEEYESLGIDLSLWYEAHQS